MATGTFGPFSDAVVQGYKQLLPDLRFELVDQPGSRPQSSSTGRRDGRSGPGAGRHRLYGVSRPSARGLIVFFWNIRGVAVLNSSTVHLLVRPRLRARSINDLKGLRIGVGPAGTGSAVTSELLLSPYAADALRTLGVAAGQTADTVLAGELDGQPSRYRAFHTTKSDARHAMARVWCTSTDRRWINSERRIHFSDRCDPRRHLPEPARILFQTLSIDIVLLTRKDLDAALVRQLTAALFHMLPRLTSELDFLKGMDPERAPATPIPLHRGATLYYRERELRR